jgi:hypothetical protein
MATSPATHPTGIRAQAESLPLPGRSVTWDGWLQVPTLDNTHFVDVFCVVTANKKMPKPDVSRQNAGILLFFIFWRVATIYTNHFRLLIFAMMPLILI